MIEGWGDRGLGGFFGWRCDWWPLGQVGGVGSPPVHRAKSRRRRRAARLRGLKARWGRDQKVKANVWRSQNPPRRLLYY